MDGASWSQHEEGRRSSSRTKVTANVFARPLDGEIKSILPHGSAAGYLTTIEGDREGDPIQQRQQEVASGNLRV